MNNATGSKSAKTKRPMTDAQRAALAKAHAASAAKRKAAVVESLPAATTVVESQTASADTQRLAKKTKTPQVERLREITPNHQDRRCEWKHPKTCGEYAAYCLPDGRLVCHDHAPVPAKNELPTWVKSAVAGPPVPPDDAAAPTVANDAPATRVAPNAPKKPARAATAPRGGAAAPGSRSKEATGAPTPAPGTIRSVGSAWLAHLAQNAHTPATVASYARDLDLAYQFFGDVDAAEAQRRIAEFNASKLCLQKGNGKPKARPTVAKTQRALRMALEWGAAAVAG